MLASVLGHALDSVWELKNAADVNVRQCTFLPLEIRIAIVCVSGYRPNSVKIPVRIVVFIFQLSSGLFSTASLTSAVFPQPDAAQPSK